MAAHRYDQALAREVAATGWYLGLPAVQVGAVCAVCEPGTLVRADQGTLLRELRADARAKGRQPQPQAYPNALEARYRAQLRRRVRNTHKLTMQAIKAALVPLAPEINARSKARDRADAASLQVVTASRHDDDLDLAELLVSCRLDSPTTDKRALLRVIARVQAAVAVASPVQTELLFTLAQQVRSYATRSVTSQILTVVGVDVLPTLGNASHLLGKWADDQAKLIKSLDSRYFDEIRDAVTTTVVEGHSTRTLSKAIADRYGVARSRADLIATDQVGTLNGKITEERQTSLGIESYIWDNSGDQRVRPIHRDAPEGIGGTTRKWSQPHPTEGHPGLPIRCRCSALPVI